MKGGTKWAVETALSAIYPDSVVQEWFEYNGEPYTFRLQINEDYIELLDHDLNIQSQEDENYYIRLSSIQLSEMGIHMMMELPENDIHRFLDRFHSALVLKDGTVIDLELHHSIRGKKAPFRASGEELFDETIALNEIHAVVICGQEVLVNSR